MSIKAVLLDLDGTLVDSEVYYTNGTIEWLSEKGVNITKEEVSKIIGKNMEETYKYLSKVSGLDYNTVKCENTKFFDNHPIDFKKYLFSDVLSFLEKAKKLCLKICICSMSPKEYIKQFINECKLNTFIDYYISGEECKNNKPDPEIYINALKKLNINKSEALIVEDSQSGIDSGLSSGAYVVARNNAKFGLTQVGVLHIFDDLNEVFDFIEVLNNA